MPSYYAVKVRRGLKQPHSAASKSLDYLMVRWMRNTATDTNDSNRKYNHNGASGSI